MNKRKEMLAHETIGKLLSKLSLPAMVGMLVQASYNLVDTIFIGRGIGTLGIGSLTICFPIQMLIMAIALIFGIGSSSIISRALGAHKDEQAEKVFGTMVASIVIISIIITIFGLFFTKDILKLFGATPTLLPYAKDYITIIFMGTLFSSFSMSANNIVRAEGNSKIAMNTMLISAGMNIVLDPVFIFVLDMGIRGAAIATVLAQVCSTIYLFYYFFICCALL